jgi:hypothetical protein
MGLEHREQPKIGEEEIRPLFMIAKTSTLTRTMIMTTQHRTQPTTNKSIDWRERTPVSMLEVAIAARACG